MTHPLIERVNEAIKGSGIAHFTHEEIARLGTVLNDAGLASALDIEANPKLTSRGVYGYMWGVVLQEGSHAL